MYFSMEYLQVILEMSFFFSNSYEYLKAMRNFFVNVVYYIDQCDIVK